VQLGKSTKYFKSRQIGTVPEIRWCAFYADCHHEVLPVEEGWRVALSFDLVLPEDSSVKTQTANPGLVAAIRETLGVDTATPSLEPWVFLLDHQYTEHGLRWHLLKDRDRVNATALRVAAEKLGLGVHLALAEVHQSWEADYRKQPEGLIDELLTLDFWVDTRGQISLRGDSCIDPNDANSFTKTGRKFLTNKEYEGYTGNAGATLDYWYRRAAVVIESEIALLRAQFTTDFGESLAKLRADSKKPDMHAKIASVIPNLLDIFKMCITGTESRFFAAMADIAMVLPTEQAHSVLANFNPAQFKIKDAPILAKLERVHGEQWMLKLIEIWANPELHNRRYSAYTLTDNQLWPEKLLAFTQACVNAHISATVLTAAMNQNVLELSRLLPELAKLNQVDIQSVCGKLLDATCDLAAAIRVVEPSGGNLARALILLISEQPTLYPLDSLGPLFAHCVWADYTNKLRENVVSAIRKIIYTFERDPDDYTVRNVIWQCKCTDCMQVINWAGLRTNAKLDLAMVERRRNHVEASLRAAHAPFGMETIKQGLPYSLVLSKPTNLHDADKATRERLQRDLDLLTTQA
jgi:hypothetical protein